VTAGGTPAGKRLSVPDAPVGLRTRTAQHADGLTIARSVPTDKKVKCFF